MRVRRLVLLVTGLTVAALAATLAVVQWELADRIASAASAIAGVAAVGVAVWAALPAASVSIRVLHTGKAAAGLGGSATSGLSGPRVGLPATIHVEGTGDGEGRQRREERGILRRSSG